jgi:hypothetical protein
LMNIFSFLHKAMTERCPRDMDVGRIRENGNGARRIVSKRQMMRAIKRGDQIGSAWLREDASQAMGRQTDP